MKAAGGHCIISVKYTVLCYDWVFKAIIAMTNHINTFSEQPDDLVGPRPQKERVSGVEVTIPALQLPLSKKLVLLTAEGKVAGCLRRNMKSNNGMASYMLEPVQGFNILLPAPSQYTIADCQITINYEGDIRFDLGNSGFVNNCDIVDAEDEHEAMSIEGPLREIAPEWQEIDLDLSEQLVFVGPKGNVLARIYRVPESNEYFLRDFKNALKMRIKEGEHVPITGTSGKTINLAVENGKFKVKGEQNVEFMVEQMAGVQKVERGKDGDITGFINGGRQLAMSSNRVLGMVNSHYLYRNEDNAGFNAQTVVVADGMGGQPHGEIAADIVVDAVLKNKGPDFRTALIDAHNRMEILNTYFYQQGRINSDAVMVAGRFSGDLLETVVLGDARIYVIRGAEVVFRTRDHSQVSALVAAGQMTKRQALESRMRSQVVTCMSGDFKPDYDRFALQAGDRIVFCSDGGIMSDDVLIRSVVGRTAEEAVQTLKECKTDENETGGYLEDPDDGGYPVLMVSRDNTTFAVVVHD